MQNNTTTATAPGLSMQELNDLIDRELQQGSSQDSVTGILIARGWPEVTARQFVARAAQSAPARPAPIKVEERQSAILVYKRRMLRGLLWMLGGFVISVASLSLVRSNGGGSLVFFGAMIFGVIDFLAGFVGWWRCRK
jgi:hypothetical protein